MSNIPKVIHYCWFGNNLLPKLGQKCIESWEKHCPGYRIIKWDESNFDITSNQYVKEAYEAKKYAFVSDYVRLHALYKHGGIYMDTDVEVLKPLDVFLSNKAFSGFEDEIQIPTGIMACMQHHPLFKKFLEYYDERSFIRKDGTLDLTDNVKIITGMCTKEGFIPNNTKQTIADFTLYPKDYFCPKNFYTGKIQLTQNTCTIHHFNSSWFDKERKLLLDLRRIFGNRNGLLVYGVVIRLMHPVRTLRKVISKTQQLLLSKQ
jgi:hypothetical protein